MFTFALYKPCITSIVDTVLSAIPPTIVFSVVRPSLSFGGSRRLPAAAEGIYRPGLRLAGANPISLPNRIEHACEIFTGGKNTQTTPKKSLATTT